MTTLIATAYARAVQVDSIKKVVGGIVAAFIGTLLVVLIKLAVGTLVDIPTSAMAVGAFGVQRFLKIDTVWIVVIGALISLLVFR